MLVRCVLLFVLIACSKDNAAESVPRDTALSWQRVVLLGSDASEIPFLLGLPRGSATTAVVVSGPQRAVARVKRAGTGLRVEFPAYLTALVLEPAPSNGYTGRYEMASPAWGKGTLPLRATPVSGPTLAALATVTGTTPVDLGEARTFWRIKIGELAFKLVIDQRAAGEHEGSMFFENGNVAYMGGTGRDDHLLLAGFEGAAPFSLDLRFEADRKRVTGTWRGGQLLAWKEAVTGERTADYDVQPKVSIDGDGVVLKHPQLKEFDGKPLIVELGGTWCPTCRRVAPKLREIYDQYHSRGLAMATLLYEMTANAAENRDAEVRFREAHHIPWPVHAVAGTQDDLFDLMPEGIKDVDVGGFPVVIFRRRDGTIAGVHSGFPAESTGAPYQATLAKFQRLTAEIMK